MAFFSYIFMDIFNTINIINYTINNIDSGISLPLWLL